jgi:hypothetical protein
LSTRIPQGSDHPLTPWRDKFNEVVQHGASSYPARELKEVLWVQPKYKKPP